MKDNNSSYFSSTNQPKNKLVRDNLKEVTYSKEDLEVLYINLFNKIDWDLINSIKLKIEIITKSKKLYKYYFPKCIGGNDSYIGSKKLYYELNKLNLTTQIYYDILFLKINSPKDRPTCEICGGEVEFLNINSGYRKTCSLSCASKVSNGNPKNFTGKYNISDEERKRRSERMKNRVITDSTRRKMSVSAINRIKRDKNRFENLIINSRSSNKVLKYKGKIEKKIPKKSNEEFLCLSSYESYFLDICDSNKLVKHIYKPDIIDYIYNGSNKIYIPDFKIELIDGIILIVEIKPFKFINDPMVIYKRLYGKKYCKDHGYKYVTLSEPDIFKKNFLNFYDYIL